jgi:hypothetical protein
MYDPEAPDLYQMFGLSNMALRSEVEEVRFKGGTIGFPS